MNTYMLKAAFPVLMVLTLVGCAEQKNEESSGPTGKISTTQTVPTANVNPIPAPTGGSIPSTSGCNGKTNVTGPVKEWSVQGYTTEIQETPLNGITEVDRMIKVQIVPESAIISADGSNPKNYTQLAADVTLLRNGVPVHSTSITFPGSVDSNGYRNGITVGQGYTKDLSSYITQNGSYSIRISNVMTSNICSVYCTAAQYTISIPTDYYTCMSWAAFGYAWTYQGCTGPDYTMINTCKVSKCNVGAQGPNAGWKLRVKVETDKTECL